jgi:tetratricopeptide (TPR) repeat protein
VSVWANHAAREEARYRDGESRLSQITEDDALGRQLARMGNAAGGAGLAHLMAGEHELATEWFDRAVELYRESFPLAPPGAWGRPIGMIKAKVLAGDWQGAGEVARWTLDQGAATAGSTIARYAATLALLVLGRDEQAGAAAAALEGRDDFPADVAASLSCLAAGDGPGYCRSVASVLRSFETREEYLEDVPVADTVLVLQALARRRDLSAKLSSPLLPG